MDIFVRLLVGTIAVLVAAYLLPGVHVINFLTAVVVAIVLGIANTIIKPILLILTLPITILTLGLFTFVINGLIVLLVTVFVPGFRVDNIWWAILFSILLSLITWFLNRL